MDQSFHLTLCGTLRHTVALGTDVYGNIQRIDNMFDGFEGKLQYCKEQLETEKQQLEDAKTQVNNPFVHEEELKEKTERLAALNALLNMDKNENEIVDDERDESEDAELEPEREAEKDAR